MQIDSATRSEQIQQAVRRVNKSAAPAYGAAPSSHEWGTTVDLEQSPRRNVMFKKKQTDGDRWAVVLISFNGKEEYVITVFDYEWPASVTVKRLNHLAESWRF